MSKSQVSPWMDVGMGYKLCNTPDQALVGHIYMLAVELAVVMVGTAARK